MNGAALALAVGVPAALLSAASFATSGFLQHRATHEVPLRVAGSPRLLIDLLGHRLWRRSVGLAILGFALQVLALRYAPLILVQPLLVTGVLWFVVISTLVHRHPPQRMLVCGVLLCLGSLSVFLLLARPSRSSGPRPGSPWSALPLALGLGIAFVACLVLAATVGRRWRALPLSLATGVCYGVTASLVRSLSDHFGEGLSALVRQWQLYALIVLGPVGVLLNQNSYQAGRLGAPALTVITVTDPLVSLAAGLVWLGESIRTGTWYVVGEVCALLALTGGVLLLARYAAPGVSTSPAAPTPPGGRGVHGRAGG
ncbi:DMT family transporter [Planosporangium sp. 12N6]|uniref:DMT family transporter n=1 Tax=Planosporangium spinosum TaxID=3402278 RepID=UPI003CF8447F